ncbi:hypothetical protein GCM10020331_072240 [Ectobacillus funiculus]
MRYVLGWKHEEGCVKMPSCVKLLFRYDLARGICRRKKQSRLVNERMHANIQKKTEHTQLSRVCMAVLQTYSN